MQRQWQSKWLRLKSSLFLLISIAACILTIAIGPVTVAQTVTGLLKLDFESNTLTPWKKESCCGYSVQVNSNRQYVRSGNYSARFELRKTDPDISSSRRTELALKAVPAHSEYWYGFSMRLASSWTPDQSFEIVGQWHNLPDFALGEDWRSPAFYFTTKLDKIRIVNRWDPKPVTLNNDPRPEGGIAQLWEGTIVPGEWVDWVVHAKWSHEADGVLQVWRNGKMVVDKRGPNTYNDKYGPYFKVGIYKPDWKYKPSASSTSTRILHIDEFRMMSATDGGNYAAVAPGGSSAKVSTTLPTLPSTLSPTVTATSGATSQNCPTTNT